MTPLIVKGECCSVEIDAPVDVGVVEDDVVGGVDVGVVDEIASLADSMNDIFDAREEGKMETIRESRMAIE